jgi:N6-L-threonylcarbamoyladenine synthase
MRNLAGTGNSFLYRQFYLQKITKKKKISKTINLVFPPPKLCTDNGVMAAWAGIEKLNLG